MSTCLAPGCVQEATYCLAHGAALAPQNKSSVFLKERLRSYAIVSTTTAQDENWFRCNECGQTWVGKPEKHTLACPVAP
jgi:hypothetical protein